MSNPKLRWQQLNVVGQAEVVDFLNKNGFHPNNIKIVNAGRTAYNSLKFTIFYYPSVTEFGKE